MEFQAEARLLAARWFWAGRYKQPVQYGKESAHKSRAAGAPSPLGHYMRDSSHQQGGEHQRDQGEVCSWRFRQALTESGLPAFPVLPVFPQTWIFHQARGFQHPQWFYHPPDFLWPRGFYHPLVFHWSQGFHHLLDFHWQQGFYHPLNFYWSQAFVHIFQCWYLWLFFHILQGVSQYFKLA